MHRKKPLEPVVATDLRLNISSEATAQIEAMNGQSDALNKAAARSTGTADTERRQNVVAAGGVLGALAASSCCLLPLALFSLGIGGAWIGNLTALAPYQPVFVALALGLTGYRFWLAYRKRPASADGEVCARPLPNRLVKTMLWAATALVAAALAFPYVAPRLLGA
jgi:mercuric ion transport protein